MISYTINKLSSFFKTDFNYILKGGSITVLGQGMVMMISFVLSIAFAKYLSQESYGTYQYIITVAELLAVFTLTGLSSSVVKSVAKGYESSLNQGFKLHIRWSVYSMLVGILISGYYLFYGNYTLGIGILAAILATPLIAASKLYICYLQGKQLFFKSSQYTVIGNLFPNIALIVTLFLTNSVLVICLTYFISHLAINYLFYKTIDSKTSKTPVDEGLSTHSKHLSIQDIIIDTTGQIDKLMLFHFGNAATLAQYVFAVNIPRQFQLLFKTAKAIVLPKISQRSYEELQKTLLRKIGVLYLFFIPVTIGYILLAPYIFKIFFTQYESAVIYSQIYSLVLLCLPTRLIREAMIGHDKQQYLYKISIYSSFVKVALSIGLIPFIGIWGVLISILFTQVIYSALSVIFFVRKV